MTMAPKMEESRAHRVENSEMRFVTLKMSQLAFDALSSGGESGLQQRAEARIELAIRLYLRDRGSDQAAWPYPAFLRGSEVSEEVELRLGLDQALWRSFEAEASRQDVSVEQLAEHAAFYFVAELEAGRITQRILNELESDDVGS
jgi:hypothetical protein